MAAETVAKKRLRTPFFVIDLRLTPRVEVATCGAVSRPWHWVSTRMSSRRPALEDRTYRLLVEAVVDYAIFLLDPEGRVSSWNAGAERIKGYTAEDVIGRPFSLFFTEEDRRLGLPER